VTDIRETVDESTYELSGREQMERTVELVEDRGGNALGVRMDVSDEAEVERAVDRGVDEFGRIDILANNAGVAPVEGLIELDERTWDLALDVNLKGMWLCAKHVGDHMIERGEGGRIVNTSSTAGLVASPGLGHYTAANHGCWG
jgi:NAD(P)-dependent dehydrogenase (short-subunit alcohol dehydrogenase family)